MINLDLRKKSSYFHFFLMLVFKKYFFTEKDTKKLNFKIFFFKFFEKKTLKIVFKNFTRFCIATNGLSDRKRHK